MYLLYSSYSRWGDIISHISVPGKWLIIDFNQNPCVILELCLLQINRSCWFHYGEYIGDTGAPRGLPSFDSHHSGIILFHCLMTSVLKLVFLSCVLLPISHFNCHSFTVCFVFRKTFLTLLIWNISDTRDLFCITPF